MKISVCIATYNGAKFIEDQLDSIRSQISLNDEIIISDDGSSDNTIQIIKDINDSRIKLIINEEARGLVKNFENAIMNSTGEYIFLCDQDDVWLPDKVEVFKVYLNQYDLVVSDCFITNSNLEIINDSFFKKNKSKKGVFNNLIFNSYLGCCMAFNRRLLSLAIPFPRDIIAHDIWLGLMYNIYGKVCFIDERLILYRRHGLNHSQASSKSSNSFYFKIKYRFKLVLSIIRRIIKNS
jgi:glycosyltransferase involved in cell wall biosynthesis